MNSLDQQELLWRIFRIRVDEDTAVRIIYNLWVGNVIDLLREGLPGLTAYLEEQLDDLDFFIVELEQFQRIFYHHPKLRSYVARF